MKNSLVTKNYKVSVIITTYNDEEYLGQALKSVLAQTLKPCEILVIVDGSKNQLAEEIAQNEYFELQQTQYLRIIRKKNGGASSARNKGIRQAKGKFVAFLDVDDMWLKDHLEKKYRILSLLDPSYFGVYGSYIFSHNNRIQPFMISEKIKDVTKIGMKNGFPGGAPSYLFMTSLLLEIGGFDDV